MFNLEELEPYKFNFDSCIQYTRLYSHRLKFANFLKNLFSNTGTFL